MLVVRHFQLATEQANCYVAADPETGDAVLIDAGEFRPEVVDFCTREGIRVHAVLITHPHYDHQQAAGEYVAALKIPVVIGGSSRCGRENIRIVDDGEIIHCGSLHAVAISVPGHTPDQMCYYFSTDHTVFTGDSLFAGSVGGTASEALRDEQVEAIRNRLLVLPDETRVFSGHGPVSTIGLERRFNPFLA